MTDLLLSIKDKEIQTNLMQMRFDYNLDIVDEHKENLTFSELFNLLKKYNDFEFGDDFDEHLAKSYSVENIYDRGKKILEELAYETFSLKNVFSKIQNAIEKYTELEREWFDYFCRQFYTTIMTCGEYNESTTIHKIK